MGVMGLGQGIFGRVRVEESVAVGAAVLRVDEFDVAWPSSNEVAHVMQHTDSGPIAKAGFAAPWTRKTRVVATASDHLGFG